jgi:hypothetical protein
MKEGPPPPPPVPSQGIEFPFPGPVKDFHSLDGDLIDLAAGIPGRIDECFDLTDTAEVQLWGNILISGQQLNLRYYFFFSWEQILGGFVSGIMSGLLRGFETFCRSLRYTDH